MTFGHCVEQPIELRCVNESVKSGDSTTVCCTETFKVENYSLINSLIGLHEVPAKLCGVWLKEGLF